MIRVLHMIGSLNIGGSQTMLMSVYKKIDRSKIQFDFILDHSDQLYFAEEVKKLGGKIYFMPEFKGKNIIEVKKAWNQFFKEHKEYKILHSHVRSYASIFVPIAKRYGVYTIVHSHSTSNGSGFSAIVKACMQFPIRFQADFFMACSDIAGVWLFGKKIVSKPNYMMLANAIDVDLYDFQRDVREKVRDELGIKDKFVVGHVGRMTEPKNHVFLVNVFAKIAKSRDDARLLLVGDGDLRSIVQNEINKNNLQDKVLILGDRKNTHDYYQAMDVFVFPSLWEGLGIVVIEAQTSGLPCFVSERIPKEVDLGIGLIKRINLNDGDDVWASEIKRICIKTRKGHKEDVCKAGYDVKNNAFRLQEFYTNISS